MHKLVTRAILFPAMLVWAAGALAQEQIHPFTAQSFESIKTEFAGQEFLVGLWSVDCPPCLVELSMMGDLLKSNPDLPFVLISTDPYEDRQWAHEFLEDFDLAGRDSWMFADNFEERLRFSIDPTWYGELPRSYFFDSNHQRESHSGLMTRELLDSWFSRPLAD